MKRRARLLGFVLCCIPFMAMAQGAAPVATLDRSKVGLGETVTLNIEVADEADGSPDLSPLMSDFVVLGTSTNHTLSIVNGKREARTILGIALRPRREGHLTVPALAIGGQSTQPVSVDVAASTDTGAATAEGRPVALEGKADPSTAYVGQQIDYTLRLYFAVNLADGQLGDPSAEGAEVRRIGQDANYQTMRGGRRFNVVERHYAIFPQHPGTLDIQPPTFQGTAVDPTDATSFFGAGEPVNAVAERVRVDVRARPDGAAGGAWIPARELKLTLEGIPADGKARVGQPVTLTMRLDATGMPFEALPALSLPKLDGADVYPDKAVTGGGSSGAWVTGRRQQGFAVVPTRPGTLHIPATTLHWWNVVTDKPEVATVPAHDIEVTAAGATQASVPPSSTAGGAAAPAPAGTSAPAPAVGTRGGSTWRWLFVAVLSLWLATLVAWFVLARRRGARGVAVEPRPKPEIVREKPAHEQFLKVAAGGDLAAVEHALLRWARIARPSIHSLGALSAALREGPQREAIAMLQRARFADGEAPGPKLREAFAKGFDWAPSAAKGDEALPPLYPR
ncbi:Oxygen tolerance [Luteibacter sp. UNC138MFCol5.1]|uniref:BatD family protein n=1 Tax=Luteibacter sp. UNC138MFCol5.1 TaxID=1502774 RepID=UPI0008C5B038|nr:BatD family protein [Luteibacter sp. UNC138MFCol5.1]SEO45799.1 Oxygen tolerance [Luteibacter sp. UNC138MFCol5.1]